MKSTTLVMGLMCTSLLGACSTAEEVKQKKDQEAAEEFAGELNEYLTTPEEVKSEVEMVEDEESVELASEEGVNLDWSGNSIELPENLTEQTFTEDTNGTRWYENGSPVEHNIYTYDILRIDTNKRMASDITPYELLPEEGHTQIIIELLVEHTGNRPSRGMDSMIPRLYSLKEGWEELEEYRLDQEFRPLGGLNKTYYEIIGDVSSGQPRKTDRGNRFITHMIYEVPDELLTNDNEWVLYQTDGIIGYSGTPYSRHLGKLQ